MPQRTPVAPSTTVTAACMSEARRETAGLFYRLAPKNPCVSAKVVSYLTEKVMYDGMVPTALSAFCAAVPARQAIL